MIDVLASKAGRTIQIQVKARSEGAKGDCSLKTLRLAEHVFYVVVDLKVEGASYFIVPGTSLVDIYYQSPCGMRGRNPQTWLEPFKSRRDLAGATSLE
jgi:hypothetical protein